MRFLVLLLMTSVAVIGANSLVLSPILSDIAESLDATAAQVARATAAYGGATAISALFWGRLADRFGGRRTLFLGLGLLCLALMGCAFAWHWSVLALSQGVAGVAAGILLPCIYAMAVEVARPGEDARVLGRVLTGWSVSMVAGVPLSAFVTDVMGWRVVFVLLSCLALVVLLSCRVFPNSQRVSEGVGALSPQAVLKIPGVLSLFCVCLAFMASFYGVYSFVGDYVRLTLGVSAGAAGLIVLFYGAGFGLASFGDALIDRVGARRLFPVVMLMLALVYSSLVLAVQNFTTVLLISVIWGFVNHFGLNLLILLLSRTDPSRRSAILGVNSAVTYLGAMVGAALFGEVYSLGGFQPLAMMAAGAMLVAGAIAWRSGRRVAPEVLVNNQ